MRRIAAMLLGLGALAASAPFRECRIPECQWVVTCIGKNSQDVVKCGAGHENRCYYRPSK